MIAFGCSLGCSLDKNDGRAMPLQVDAAQDVSFPALHIDLEKINGARFQMTLEYFVQGHNGNGSFGCPFTTDRCSRLYGRIERRPFLDGKFKEGHLTAARAGTAIQI